MSSLKDYMIVSYGYETIYGFSGGGLERIRKEIVEFNLYGILETCAKIAPVLLGLCHGRVPAGKRVRRVQGFSL